MHGINIIHFLMVISTNRLILLLLRQHTFTFYFETSASAFINPLKSTERVMPLNILPFSNCLNHYHFHVFLNSPNQIFSSSFSIALFFYIFFDNKIYNSLSKVIRRLPMYTWISLKSFLPIDLSTYLRRCSKIPESLIYQADKLSPRWKCNCISTFLFLILTLQASTIIKKRL